MRNWISCFMMMFVALSLHAQSTAQKPAQQQPVPGQQAPANNNQNSDAQRPADTLGTNNAPGGSTEANGNQNGSNAVAGNPQGTNGALENGGTSNAAASNTPAVEQTTTSQSGSPAVLSGQNGVQRDGTNNVQRASMNMVGSPVDNLNLGDGK